MTGAHAHTRCPAPVQPHQTSPIMFDDKNNVLYLFGLCLVYLVHHVCSGMLDLLIGVILNLFLIN